MKPEVLAKFKMAAAAILFSRLRPPFRCYLSDRHEILHTVASNTATYCKMSKPEVEIEIQDGSGGHLGFLKTQ
jgi:hypothetical protein